MRVCPGDARSHAAQLLQLQYTKVEQCGSGAAACGIIDSIFQVRSPVTVEHAVAASGCGGLVDFGLVADSMLGRASVQGQIQRQA